MKGIKRIRKEYITKKGRMHGKEGNMIEKEEQG